MVVQNRNQPKKKDVLKCRTSLNIKTKYLLVYFKINFLKILERLVLDHSFISLFILISNLKEPFKLNVFCLKRMPKTYNVVVS